MRPRRSSSSRCPRLTTRIAPHVNRCSAMEQRGCVVSGGSKPVQLSSRDHDCRVMAALACTTRAVTRAARASSASAPASAVSAAMTSAPDRIGVVANTAPSVTRSSTRRRLGSALTACSSASATSMRWPSAESAGERVTSKPHRGSSSLRPDWRRNVIHPASPAVTAVAASASASASASRNATAEPSAWLTTEG